jgi:hypothetical protein
MRQCATCAKTNFESQKWNPGDWSDSRLQDAAGGVGCLHCDLRQFPCFFLCLFRSGFWACLCDR